MTTKATTSRSMPEARRTERSAHPAFSESGPGSAHFEESSSCSRPAFRETYESSHDRNHSFLESYESSGDRYCGNSDLF